MRKLFILLVGIFSAFIMYGCENNQNIEVDTNRAIQRKMSDVHCVSQCLKGEVCKRVKHSKKGSSVISWECGKIHQSKGHRDRCTYYYRENYAIKNTCPSNFLCVSWRCEYRGNSQAKGQPCRDYLSNNVFFQTCKEGLHCREAIHKCVKYDQTYGQKCDKHTFCATPFTCKKGRCLISWLVDVLPGGRCQYTEECSNKYKNNSCSKHGICRIMEPLSHGQQCKFSKSGIVHKWVEFKCKKELVCRLGHIDKPLYGFFCLYPHHMQVVGQACSIFKGSCGDTTLCECGNLCSNTYLNECQQSLYCNAYCTNLHCVGNCTFKKKRGSPCAHNRECQTGKCLETVCGKGICVFKRKRVGFRKKCYSHSECRGASAACVNKKCTFVRRGRHYSPCKKNCRKGLACVLLCDKQKRCVYQMESRKIGQSCRIDEDCKGCDLSKAHCAKKMKCMKI